MSLILITNLDIHFEGINRLRLFRFPRKAVPKFCPTVFKAFFQELPSWFWMSYISITVSKIIINLCIHTEQARLITSLLYGIIIYIAFVNSER